MSLAVIKKTIKALSHQSQKAPDIFYIEGYFMGLGVHAQTVLPSAWLPDLFGSFSEAEPAQLNAVMDFYNICMQKVMDNNLTLPNGCALSKTDLAGSLAKGQPLPSYCLGMLASLKLIDKRSLDKKQKEALRYLVEILTGFTSLKAAQREFNKIDSHHFESEAHGYKRLLTTYVFHAIEAIRFRGHLDGAGYENEDDHFQAHDDDESELEELIDFLTDSTSLDKLPLIDQFILTSEQSFITKSFKAANSGHFWLMTETRPYMFVRAHRARINFEHGQYGQAADELQELLELNPNDNQANRFMLVNALILSQQWDALAAVLKHYADESIFMLSAKALLLFAKEGDSLAAQQVKKALLQENKHFMRMLTGQEKVKNEDVPAYSLGSKEEVQVYIDSGGKKAWLSVQGSLFWLRKK